MKLTKFAIFLFTAIIIFSCGGASNHTTLDSILDLYEHFDLVHLGERHWNMTDFNFRVSLVTYPRFAEVVDDIIIESGNYLYQDILDKFILELQDVPESDLQKIWRNTVVTTGVWDATIYKDFIYVIRKVNKRLPRAERIRLIASEPPIEWSRISTFDEWWRFLAQRNTHTAKIVKSEVVDKGRKALIIYGGAHFYKSAELAGGCSDNIREYLEYIYNITVFSILPLSGDDLYSNRFSKIVGATRFPAFINLRTSKLFDLSGNLFFAEAPGKLGDFTDGILFFGNKRDEEAIYDQEAASNSGYQAELARRRAIVSQW